MTSATVDRPTTAAPANFAGPGEYYYEFERPEIIALIPSTARRVLEFGCAGGACGARIKRERGAYVAGIEILPGPAERARTRLDRVVVGDCEQMDFAELFQAGEFDAILFADVLEHLRDPEAILERVKPLLSEDGVIVASIPNVRNLSVVAMLAQGDWSYQNAGLMDRTHVHFFTKREAQRAFGRAGYKLDGIRYVYDANHAKWVESGRPSGIDATGITLKCASPEDAEELFVYQMLVRARVAPPPPFSDRARPAVSIVIPVKNQLEMTKGCVESIRAYSPDWPEIIVVDNASEDGTAAWASAEPGVRHIRNDENRGFAGACNQGIAAATGDYVVLLNNDTIVTPGWLEALVAPMAYDETIGCTGPRSNWVFSQQKVDECRYGRDVKAMLAFADDWCLRHQATGLDTGKLVGFCMAIRRELIEKIGGLDERFGLGFFEDDDYSVRTLLAGYRLWIANDSFVHHWGSQSFRSEPVDQDGWMVKNGQVFAQKWGVTLDLRTGYSMQSILRQAWAADYLRCPLPAPAAV